jgi:hypothetical protein
MAKRGSPVVFTPTSDYDTDEESEHNSPRTCDVSGPVLQKKEKYFEICNQPESQRAVKLFMPPDHGGDVIIPFPCAGVEMNISRQTSAMVISPVNPKFRCGGDFLSYEAKSDDSDKDDLTQDMSHMSHIDISFDTLINNFYQSSVSANEQVKPVKYVAYFQHCISHVSDMPVDINHLVFTESLAPLWPERKKGSSFELHANNCVKDKLDDGSIRAYRQISTFYKYLDGYRNISKSASHVNDLLEYIDKLNDTAAMKCIMATMNCKIEKASQPLAIFEVMRPPQNRTSICIVIGYQEEYLYGFFCRLVTMITSEHDTHQIIVSSEPTHCDYPVVPAMEMKDREKLAIELSKSGSSHPTAVFKLCKGKKMDFPYKHTCPFIQSGDKRYMDAAHEILMMTNKAGALLKSEAMYRKKRDTLALKVFAGESCICEASYELMLPLTHCPRAITRSTRSMQMNYSKMEDLVEKTRGFKEHVTIPTFMESMFIDEVKNSNMP